ncbi:MAG: hypothetical protein DMG13_23185 [Acidobacteria bacterium]|nr:MAG: hypothetical protein DMG13_23185 [Acidobacteriota bacterium]
MKCTDLLVQDHKIILRALNVIEHMAARVENDQFVETADVESILRFLRTFADDHHQTKEESALFPELMRTSAAQEGPLRQMLFEHDQERSLVEGLEDALYTKKGAEFVYFANRLTALLRNHIRKEDDILFEIVERTLSSEQDEKVTEQFNKFEINVKFQKELHRLEWKYLNRAA